MSARVVVAFDAVNSLHQRNGGTAVLVDTYLNEMSIARAPRTVRLRRYQLWDWVAWLDGDVRDATRADVIRYLQRWVCPDTRASRCAALSGFYRWARALNVIPRSPVEMVEVRGRGLPNPNPIPDDVLIAALVNAGPTERDAVILGRFAGLRASEIAAVHRRDLDQRPDHLRVVGKGSKIRYVPVHDEVRRLVESVDGYVFPGRGHPERHWTASPITKRVSAVLPAPWTCHSLRHAFATSLYAACRDWAVVQDALGHASMDTTRRYVLMPDAPAVAAVRSLTLVGGTQIERT